MARITRMNDSSDARRGREIALYHPRAPAHTSYVFYICLYEDIIVQIVLTNFGISDFKSIH